MALNIEDIGKKMLAAALPILTSKAPGIAQRAAGEFAKIAQSLATIEVELASGEINEQQAALLLDIQKNASRSVLLASEGLSLLVAEEAINAALKVVKEAVNAALHVNLL